MSRRAVLDWGEVRQRLAASEAAVRHAGEADAEALERVFRDRARRLAERPTNHATATAHRDLLLFTLAEERFALDVERLTELFPLGRVTRVPGSAPELLGVVNFRGEIHAVADLARMVGLTGGGGRGFGLLLGSGERPPVLRVDTVLGVDRVPLEDLRPSLVSSAPGSCIEALLPNRTTLLSAEAILAHPALARRS